jgi:hypothetical protein
MKVVNGYGSIENGKYKVHPKDRVESKRLIKNLQSEVEKILEAKFKEVRFIDDNKEPKYCKLVEYASGCLFVPIQPFSGPNFQSSHSEAFISVQTGTNTNGYNDKEAKRYFVISFQLKGKMRYKHQKRWERDCVIIKKYILADNLEEVINEFKFWVNNQYDNFFTTRLLQNKTWQECR